MTGTVREYLYAGGEAPTAMRARQPDGSYANYFFVTNTHGDVVAITDRDGVIVNRYAYGPWGEATRVSEQVHQPFRYAGYRYEDGFDLYYLRARWYDAGTGRFLSRDSERGIKVRPTSMNRYGYALGSPPSWADPSGNSPLRPNASAGLGYGIKVLFPKRVCNADTLTYLEWEELARSEARYLVAASFYPNINGIPFRIESARLLNRFMGVIVGGIYGDYKRGYIRIDRGRNMCSLKLDDGLSTLIHEMEHADQDYGNRYGPGNEDEAYAKEKSVLAVLEQSRFTMGSGAGFDKAA